MSLKCKQNAGYNSEVQCLINMLCETSRSSFNTGSLGEQFQGGKKEKKKKHRLEPSYAHILSSTVNYPSYRAISSLWEVFDPIRSSLKDELLSGSLNLWSLVPVCSWQGLAILLRLVLNSCLHLFKALGLQVHTTHATVLTSTALSTSLSLL